jgi:uncharacterized protein involved in outer membrane biogenesis
MTDTPTPSTAIFRTLWQRRLLQALAGLLGLWLVAWLGVPPLLKWQLQKQATAALGRTVTVEQVSFHPWSLELTLQGLNIAHANADAPQLSIDRVHVDAELQSLFRLAPVLDAVTLEHPQVHVRHLGEGRYDVDDVLARLLQPSEPSEPAQFAVFNIGITQGEIDFVDDDVGKTHEIRALKLDIPFLSNLASKREVLTQPRLAFQLNGNDFDTHAASTPFAQTRHTDASLHIPVLDVTPYLAYWPAQWPVRPEAGQLHVQLQLGFEQRDTPQVTLAGTLGASDFRWLDVRASGKTANTKPWLSWKNLELTLAASQPLERHILMDALHWEGLDLSLQRDATGQLNLATLAQGFSRPEPSIPARQSGPAPAPWQFSLKEFALRHSTVRWQDATTRPVARTDLQDLNLQVRNASWPARQAMTLEGSARLANTPIHWQGQGDTEQAHLNFGLERLPLSTFMPYWAAVLQPQLNGQLSAQGELHWQAPANGLQGALTLKLPTVGLDTLTLGQASGKAFLASLKRLQADNVSLDLSKQRLSVGQLALDTPQLQAQRNAQGRWMFEDWLKTPANTPPPATASTTPPWQVELADVQVQGGQVRLLDDWPTRPVRLDLTALHLQAKNLRPNATQTAAAPLNLSLRMAALGNGRAEPGKLQYQGQLRLPAAASVKAHANNSFHTQGRLQLDHLPVHGLEPYFGDRLNLDLVRADTSFRGTLEAGLPPEGLTLALQGDVAVEDFRASTLSPAEDLLDWKALNLRGTHLKMAAGQLRQFSVRETVLSDYFARVIVHENGQINLQTLVKPDPTPGPAPTTTAMVEAPANPTPKIEFGPIGLVNGRVHFSDRFIQPNYSANLSELTGHLGAFNNQAMEPGSSPSLADLTLRGKAENTATLDINGQLNPLARPLALNIKGAVRELELPPLSPYTVKYTGHGIERGKLSMDVSYKIDSNGQLRANNQVVLNQLSFGERVEGSNAPNLPVKLAVALLADRNGVIDINLPISGSINDPEFRLGAIVVKLIFNLIGKAITAPFALIAHALDGGGEEMNHIVFAPGSSTLDATAQQRLDSIAKALESRPVLKLTVVGQSDLEAERSGYQRARLNELVLMEKRRRLSREGTAVDNVKTVTSEEYPALLKEVYRRADMPKPRNLIGLAKDIPQEEMEKLLLASMSVNANAMRELAIQRGTVVKDYLAQQQVAVERLFLGAPVLNKTGDKWLPQAELRLATD